MIFDLFVELLFWSCRGASVEMMIVKKGSNCSDPGKQIGLVHLPVRFFAKGNILLGWIQRQVSLHIIHNDRQSLAKGSAGVVESKHSSGILIIFDESTGLSTVNVKTTS